MIGLYDISYRTINRIPVIFLFSRDKEGNKKVEQIKDFKPYIYINKRFKSMLFNVKYEEVSQTTIYNKEVLKIIMNHPSETYFIKDKLKLLNVNNDDLYESDVLFDLRYAIDKVDIVEPSNYKVMTIDIETDCKEGFPKYENPIEPIICVSIYDNYSLQLRTFIWREDLQQKDELNIHYFSNEKDMLKAMIKYWRDINTDIIIGWNLQFDIKYLVARIQKLGGNYNNLSTISEPFDTIVSKEGLKLNEAVRIREKGEVEILGVILFDLLRAYRKMHFGELASYSLNNIAFDELGEEKEKVLNTGIAWRTELPKLIKYNRKDVELTYKINDKCKLIKIFDDIKRFAGVRNINDVFYASRIHETRMMKKFKDKYVFPTKPPFEEKSKHTTIKGALVRDSTPGLYENVICIDAKSLYPSIIYTFNLSKEMISEDGMLINNIKVKQQPKGIMPSMIKELIDLKDRMKKEVQGTGQNLSDKMFAIKTFINCFTPENKIITEFGPKYINEVKKGEKVFSFNPVTKKSELKEVIDTQEYDYKGDIININSRGINVKVTPEHKFLLQRSDHKGGYKWKIAKELIDTASLYNTPKPTKIINQPKKSPKLFDLLEYVKEFNPIIKKDLLQYYNSNSKSSYNGNSIIPRYYNYLKFMKFIIWYVTEGSIVKCSKNKTTWSIDIAQEHYKRDVECLLLNLNIPFCKFKNKYNRVTYFRISNKLLYLFIEKYCYKYSNLKRIPKFIYKLSQKDKEEIVNVLVKADGYKRLNTSYYVTQSPFLKDVFNTLCYYCGYIPNTSFSKTDKTYRINISKSKYTKTFHSKRNLQVEKYNGKIYCVTVKDNHTVYSGIDDRICILGQSFYGINALTSFRLYDKRIAECITFLGREISKECAKLIKEKFKYETIYGDSDSLFIQMPQKFTDEIEQGNFMIIEGKEIQKYINESLPNIVFDLGGDASSSTLFVEFEKVYRRILFQQKSTSKEGAKKRYAGHITWEDGKVKDEIKIAGMAARRSDSAEISKQIQKDMFTMILKGGSSEEVSNKIIRYINDMFNGTVDLELCALPVKLNKPPKEYKIQNTPKIRGIKWSNKKLDTNFVSGMKFKMVYIIHPTTNVVCFDDISQIKSLKVNWDMMFDKCVLQKIEPTFNTMNWKKEYNNILIYCKNLTANQTLLQCYI